MWFKFITKIKCFQLIFKTLENKSKTDKSQSYDKQESPDKPNFSAWL